MYARPSLPEDAEGNSVGWIFAFDGFDWSNGLRYHTFDTKSGTESDAHHVKRLGV